MELTVGFSLDDRRSTLPAMILRAISDRRDDSSVEIVLTFEPSEAEAADLRRRIFAEQLRQRRQSA